eukprot:TRINITY_DN7753_c0_g1_i1.p1 TRINITY_DN7753_c0_g1~~TRINITY_DN7753_c0_g1_i1.p1  ORF type:complete len:642 (+),score=236.87 TRINITY_DN7753_c0_g1_i1:42-1928(+)
MRERHAAPPAAVDAALLDEYYRECVKTLALPPPRWVEAPLACDGRLQVEPPPLLLPRPPATAPAPVRPRPAAGSAPRVRAGGSAPRARATVAAASAEAATASGWGFVPVREVTLPSGVFQMRKGRARTAPTDPITSVSWHDELRAAEGHHNAVAGIASEYARLRKVFPASHEQFDRVLVVSRDDDTRDLPVRGIEAEGLSLERDSTAEELAGCRVDARRSDELGDWRRWLRQDAEEVSVWVEHRASPVGVLLSDPPTPPPQRRRPTAMAPWLRQRGGAAPAGRQRRPTSTSPVSEGADACSDAEVGSDAAEVGAPPQQQQQQQEERTPGRSVVRLGTARVLRSSDATAHPTLNPRTEQVRNRRTSAARGSMRGARDRMRMSTAHVTRSVASRAAVAGAVMLLLVPMAERNVILQPLPLAVPPPGMPRSSLYVPRSSVAAPAMPRHSVAFPRPSMAARHSVASPRASVPSEGLHRRPTRVRRRTSSCLPSKPLPERPLHPDLDAASSVILQHVGEDDAEMAALLEADFIALRDRSRTRAQPSYGSLHPITRVRAARAAVEPRLAASYFNSLTLPLRKGKRHRIRHPPSDNLLRADHSDPVLQAAFEEVMGQYHKLFKPRTGAAAGQLSP